MPHYALHTSHCALGLLLAAITIVCLGCSKPDESIETEYGRRRGTPGRDSINGTAVLAGMFERAGYHVSSWPRLSPRLVRADVIVWAPSTFDLPTEKQRDFLETWLVQDDRRTLVYIGRDYDGEVAYWDRVLPGAPPSEADEIKLRRDRAQRKHDAARANMPAEEYCRWFTVRRDRPRRKVRTLQGPWSSGIDASKVEIELQGCLDPPKPSDVQPDMRPDMQQLGRQDPLEFEKLLTSEGDDLVTRVSSELWSDSQIIVVANGSFLLNLPLVNHEHRRLAGHLIAPLEHELRGESDRHVVFLETGRGGPDISDREAPPTYPTGFEAFTTWPIGVILLHLFGLGIIYCVSRFPIFGRPRQLEPEARSDFGTHIAALGELLQKTGDGQYAISRLTQYRQTVVHCQD